ILFGVITVQAHLYYSRFPKDVWWIRASVTFLWLAQLTVVVITSFAIYSQTVQYVPVYPKLPWNAMYWSFHLAVSATAIQAFFAHRLWALSGRRIFTVIIIMIIIANSARSIVFNIACLISGSVSKHALPTVSLVTSLSAVIDVALALGVTLTLRKQRTGFRDTDSLLNWIILYVAATGAATSILAIVTLVWIHLGNPYSALIISVPYGGVYITCGFAHLHARTSLRTRFVAREQLIFRSDDPSLEMQSRTQQDQSRIPEIRQRAATRNGTSTISTFPITLATNNPSTGDGLEASGVSSSPDTIQIKRTVETIQQSSCDNCLGTEVNHKHAGNPPSRLDPVAAANHAPPDSIESGEQALGVLNRLPDIYVSPHTHTPIPRFSPTEMFSDGRRRLHSESHTISLTTSEERRQHPLDMHLQFRVHHLDGRGEREMEG
ncbi:hypothetical protein DL93DRAFT_2079772, partial [Clavulina sp. PMI_390]